MTRWNLGCRSGWVVSSSGLLRLLIGLEARLVPLSLDRKPCRQLNGVLVIRLFQDLDFWFYPKQFAS